MPDYGPKRRVVEVTTGGDIHHCKLECGHIVDRRKKYRRGNMGTSIEDPAPSWVYCTPCKEGAAP